jgi:L-fucose isomerase-like protein
MPEEYKNKYKIKLGLAPTRRTLTRPKFFDTVDAIEAKNQIEKKLRDFDIEYVNLDFLNNEGLLFNGNDANMVAQKFLDERVDAIFAPHCNFGTEDAVAKLAKKVNKPLLIWGPRDDVPLSDGRRTRDSQCGLFATSKVLGQFGIPFSYITNSHLTDAVFERGLKNFIAASSVVKSFRNVRLGQISTRPGAFWSVKYNELELLERFGIEIVPITLQDIKRQMDWMIREKYADVKDEVEEIKGKIKRIIITQEQLEKVVALKLAVKLWAGQENLSSIAFLCTAPMREITGIAACFVSAELTDIGLPVICETDVHGAITSVMSQAAVLGETPTFLADLTIRHPENDNAELLWHCGVFPNSLRKNGSESVLNNHYGAGTPGTIELEMKGGDITISRFDGLSGDYRLMMSQGVGIDGPKTNGSYIWVEFKDWPKLEHRLIYGPYIHHVTGVHEKIAPVLYEACRFIPGLTPDPVDPTKEEIEKYLRG